MRITATVRVVYREAARRNIPVHSVEVDVRADFEGIGLAAANITQTDAVEPPRAGDP